VHYRASGMPVEAVKTSLRELKRLKKMPPQMPEHAMLRCDNSLEVQAVLASVLHRQTHNNIT